MNTPPRRRVPGDPLEPLRSTDWLTEAQRKAIHISFIVLPLLLLYEPLPWPRGRAEWRWCLIVLTLAAIALDLVRIHDHRAERFFKRFFGGMVREHERWNLVGGTYLLIAALLAVEMFPQPIAAAALGFTVLGDGIAALVGKAWGRPRFFGKSLEGAAAGLAACLVWAGWLAATGILPWQTVVCGALVASLVELLPIPLDDNLAITLFAGFTMKLLTLPS